MNLSVGIVGLPNVGKSTLFNALLKKQQAFVANYPFATIEPNVGIVPVPDQRLEKLAEITAGEMLKQAKYPKGIQHDNEGTDKSKWPPIKPATVNFVDIAGLVKGASEGAGLGNKFLSHIREVSIIAHVVRAFEDPSASSGQVPIIREGSVGPKEDYEAIETELILADLQTITSAQSKVKRFAKESEKTAIEKLFKDLNSGKPAREIILTPEEQEFANTFFLLSAKPEIIILNVSEADYNEEAIKSIAQKYREMLKPVQHDNLDNMVVICAKIESDLSELSGDEQKQYLSELGLKESGLEHLIRRAYEKLGLISFLTAGEKEVRAWTIQKGMKAVDAAGVIHTDFTKKFIKAEVVSYSEFVSLNGWKGARENGKARLEGRDYIMQDGDVVEFKIGA
ncbi:MAG: redox-regulated ATPase YchF [Candidatus Levybacteria bacterium]|nr:redox-regulated ATPase YchF [Candidatus Levybacteria bacterium]